MRVRGSTYFLIFLVLLGLFGIIESLSFRYFQAVALPLLISSVIFVLSVVELVRELRKTSAAGNSADVEPEESSVETSVEIHRFGIALGWVVGFSTAIYLFGFLIAIPIFVFSYLKWRGKNWLAASLFAIFVLALIYGTFEFSLKAQLYRGLLFGVV